MREYQGAHHISRACTIAVQGFMCRRKLETLALPVSERVLYGNQTRLTPALLRGPGQRSHEQTLSQPLSSGLGRNGQIMQMQGVRGGDGAASIIKWWRQAPARGLRKQIGLHAAGRTAGQ